MERYIPTGDRLTVRACPDGEGSFSNNPDREEIARVRFKGSFTPEFVRAKCEEIRNAKAKIVLIDVGGKMSKENERFFALADAFIVLSSKKELSRQWQEFGRRLGIKCIAVIDSSLEGVEQNEIN